MRRCPKTPTLRRPWPDAKIVVLDAYRQLLADACRHRRPLLRRRWIDAQLRPGKDSGAFCHPTVPSAHPYVLMNYQGRARDVMTLAHELGTRRAPGSGRAARDRLMAGTPLTLAETASVFGEQLTFQALLAQETDPVRRRVLLAAKIEDKINTVVRQIAFCEFERRVHDARRAGGADAGRSVPRSGWRSRTKVSVRLFNFREDYRFYWTYIPHFIHVPFYVYAYAFGDCLVSSLYAVYEEAPDGFEPRYLELLRAGGTLRHKELLAPFGLDASDPGFWAKGLRLLEGLIDQLEARHAGAVHDQPAAARPQSSEREQLRLAHAPLCPGGGTVGVQAARIAGARLHGPPARRLDTRSS